MSGAVKVVGYARVSTDKQADKGHSLDVQKEHITAYAKLYGYDLVDIVVDDGASAITLKRPGLQRVLKMLDNGEVSGVVVTKLDRLVRSLRGFTALLDEYFNNGHILVAVHERLDTTTPNGRMVLNILMSVLQWERETVSDRTKTVARHRKAQGKRVSGLLPYGKSVAEDGVTLIDNPDEQRVIRLVRKYREQGLSYREIVTKLNRGKYVSRAGTPFRVAQVFNMVQEG